MSSSSHETLGAQIRTEIDDLLAAGVPLSGQVPSPVLLIKGELNDAERAGAAILSGADGEALKKSLKVLGYPEGQISAVSVISVLQPQDEGSQAVLGELPAELIRLAVETIDSELVILTDTLAAQRFARAYELDDEIKEGLPTRVWGRTVLALGGFEAALQDPQAKQVMWARLKEVPYKPLPY